MISDIILGVVAVGGGFLASTVFLVVLVLAAKEAFSDGDSIRQLIASGLVIVWGLVLVAAVLKVFGL